MTGAGRVIFYNRGTVHFIQILASQLYFMYSRDSYEIEEKRLE